MISLPRTSHLVVLFLCLCLLSPPTSAHWQKRRGGHHHKSIKNPLVFQTCKKAPHYGVCLSTFASSRYTNRCNNVQGLARIAVSVTLKRVHSTSSRVETLLDLFHIPTLHQSLSGCSRNYLSVSKQLNSASWLLARPNRSKAQVAMSLRVAAKAVRSCDNGFDLQFVDKKMISARNEEISQMCENALAIVQLTA